MRRSDFTGEFTLHELSWYIPNPVINKSCRKMAKSSSKCCLFVKIFFFLHQTSSCKCSIFIMSTCTQRIRLFQQILWDELISKLGAYKIQISRITFRGSLDPYLPTTTRSHQYKYSYNIWAGTLPVPLQGRVLSACASTQSGQSLLCVLWVAKNP